ncbi:MAG: ABC transporter substrate-binding protein [Thermomicrobiales bacterium]|nr:ABC transporter substrate-binding protein [Thermomicrobiales bacterium]
MMQGWRKIQRTRFPIAVILSLMFVIATLAPLTNVSAQDTPVQGGTLRMAISEEPDQLDPARTIELLAAILMDSIYDRLIYMGDDGLPHPWIAESWEISEDGLTITFKIRQGLTCHDGTPVDAAAVKFSYDRILDPAMAAPYKSFLGSMQTVEAPDASTVVMTFATPYAPFFTNSTLIGIVSPTAVQADPENFGHAPVGSGPFMFESWEPGSKIVLARNPNYVNYREDDSNKGAAYLDALEYNVISDAATQAAAFEAGELDKIDVPQEEVARLSEVDGVQIISLERTTNVNFIEFANKPPYNNPAFRKAVSHAIDRETIIELAYLGNATPNLCPIPIANAAYDEALCAEHGSAYDLELAKQALADGGFVDSDGNGFVEFEGAEVAITLWSYAPYPVQAKSIEVMQADLNAIGLKTDIQTIEFGAMQPMLESGEIGMDYMRWTFSDQSILSALFKSPGWVGQTSIPELDALLEVADTTVDPAARLEATKAVMIYILDNALIVPVNSDWLTDGVRDNVNGYRRDALVNERFIDVWLSE